MLSVGAPTDPPTGRREWTERKWTRKDDVRGRDVSCEKGLRTNEDRDTKQEWQGRATQNQSPRQKPVWKVIYLTGLPPRLQWTRDSMRRAMDCNSPGQRGEGRGQWWSTYRLGMVGNVNALPKNDFSLSRWQSCVTKSWLKYQPWITSRFKFIQVQIYLLVSTI